MDNTNNQNELITEEQIILDKMLERIQEIIAQHTTVGNEQRRALKNAIESGNKDEYVKILRAIGVIKSSEEEIKILNAIKDSLYDKRIEYFENGDTHPIELKFGKVTYIDIGNGTLLMESNNSPIARNFWGGQMPENFEYQYKDKYNKIRTITCKLALGRLIELRFSKVKSVIHAFPLTTEARDQLIVDILTEELMKRRTGEEWEPILRSIQKKQKDIVLLPFKTNLIVQGCAGSGKTMIMLHRLPILLMDNPDILFRNDMYVITPSMSYIEQAQKMTDELEIADLKMGVINQYYDYCIEKYSQKGRGYGKINPSYVLTEKQSKYLYSEQCIKDIREYYEQVSREESWLTEDAYKILKIEKDVNEDGQNYSKSLSKTLKNVQTIIKVNKKNLNNNFSLIYKIYESVSKFEVVLRRARETVLKNIEREIVSSNRLISKNEKEIEKLDPIENAKAIENRRNTISTTQSKLEMLNEIQREAKKDSLYFDKIAEIGKLYSDALTRFQNVNKQFSLNSEQQIYECVYDVAEMISASDKVKREISDIQQKYEDYMEVFADCLSEIDHAIFQNISQKKPFITLEYFTDIKGYEKNLSQIHNNIAQLGYKHIMEKLGFDVDFKKRSAIKDSPYIYLQALYQFYGAPNAAKETMITIDEAQGFAPEELKLICALNSGVVLNLFGDVKQHIEGTKGVDDWSEFDGIRSFHKEEMNQNYRNSKEITEYCNARYNLKMQAINTFGNGVHVMETEEQLVAFMEKYFHSGLVGMSAIIVKNQEEVECIKNIFNQYHRKMSDVSMNDSGLHRSRWNILTVDQVKGLEFTRVLVLTGRLSENEKYVACTRALDELIVFDKIVEMMNQCEDEYFS